MKSFIWVVIILISWLNWGASPCAAADLDKMDWTQLLVEPQPSPLLTWQENLSAHLAGVDRRLTLLRSEYRRGERFGAERRLAFHDSSQRLKNAYQFVDASLHRPESAAQMGSVQELVPKLKEAEQIVQSVTNGLDLTKEMVHSLQTVRAFVKMVRYQLLKLNPPIDRGGLEGISTNAREDPLGGHSAVIVEPGIDEIPAQALLKFPLRNTLLHLASQNMEARQSYVRRILEDEHTRLLEMIVDPGSDPHSPSYLLVVAKNVELTGGASYSVRLPFRLTVERVRVDGWWNRLRILANTATDAGVVSRTSLLTEVPVTNDVSISAYETCVSYFRSPKETHRDETLVTYAANMELTFYRHTSSRLRDVSFRSIVASKSKSALERNIQRGAQRACEELTREILLSMRAVDRRSNAPPVEPPRTP